MTIKKLAKVKITFKYNHDDPYKSFYNVNLETAHLQDKSNKKPEKSSYFFTADFQSYNLSEVYKKSNKYMFSIPVKLKSFKHLKPIRTNHKDFFIVKLKSDSLSEMILSEDDSIAEIGNDLLRKYILNSKF